MNTLGLYPPDVQSQLIKHKQDLISAAVDLTDHQIAQEQELLQLNEQWTNHYKDIEKQAAGKEKPVTKFLNDEVPEIKKGHRVIPAISALLTLRGIYLKSNHALGIEATNLQGLTDADLALSGYAIGYGVQRAYQGFNDLYDAGTGISDYGVDSTQRPSTRDPRLHRRDIISRLPLAMTAARVIPEEKSTFKITEFVPDKESPNGVYEVPDQTPTPATTARVIEFRGGMRTLKGGIDFSALNIREGDYTMEAATAWAAEWVVNAEDVIVLDCTTKIKDGIPAVGSTPAQAPAAPQVTLTWSNLTNTDLRKVANVFLFSNENYNITTMAFSNEATYDKWADVDRSKQTQDANRSDMGVATGRDNFPMAADRDIFAHPDGGIAADNALGWDARKTINVHTLPGMMEANRSLIIKQDPDMYCFRWALKFGTQFELKAGTPRRLFN